jgi:hypothetical protein
VGKILDWGFKILSALVIPLLIWGVSLEVRLAVQTNDIQRLQEDVKAALAIKDGLSANTNALGQLEVKVNAVNDTLKEVKTLLRAP